MFFFLKIPLLFTLNAYRKENATRNSYDEEENPKFDLNKGGINWNLRNFKMGPNFLVRICYTQSGILSDFAFSRNSDY